MFLFSWFRSRTIRDRTASCTVPSTERSSGPQDGLGESRRPRAPLQQEVTDRSRIRRVNCQCRNIPLPPFFAGADNVIFERLAPGQDDLRQTTLDHLDVSHLLQATRKWKHLWLFLTLGTTVLSLAKHIKYSSIRNSRIFGRCCILSIILVGPSLWKGD